MHYSRGEVEHVSRLSSFVRETIPTYVERKPYFSSRREFDSLSVGEWLYLLGEVIFIGTGLSNSLSAGPEDSCEGSWGSSLKDRIVVIL